MKNERVNVLVGNTPEKSVVYQIAERQKEILLNYYSHVFMGGEKGGCINLVHKYGVDVVGSRNVFIFHFDPYDFRHEIPMSELESYLSLFNIVICLNRKQQYFCNIRNIRNTLIPHGSDYECKRFLGFNNIEKPVVILACDYYRGNVKGEDYFFALSRIMSDHLTFMIVGKGWSECKVKTSTVNIMNVDSYTELKKYFNDADIVFIGSRYEAGPASFPDAVNSNKYIMSTPVGMVLDNFIEGESGFFIRFDLAEDASNLHVVIKKIKDNISPKYITRYIGWSEQIKEIVGVLNEEFC
ncbi:MAG: hypothetical protein RPS47_08920 [Colwellia sp.]|jgi:Glycosyl transferases group 1.